jgi:hypothetical protein
MNVFIVFCKSSLLSHYCDCVIDLQYKHSSLLHKRLDLQYKHSSLLHKRLDLQYKHSSLLHKRLDLQYKHSCVMMRIPRVQTFLKIPTTHYISDLFMQFIFSLTKINFSKENIIYYTRLHDPSMTRKGKNLCLFAYRISVYTGYLNGKIQVKMIKIDC